jgi:integrative and conjugative element protein (TIGR02256 family)
MAGAEEGAPRSERAKGLIVYLTESEDPTFAKLETVDCSGPFDTLDIVVEPQLPQDRAVPIAHEEPIRLIFWPDDDHPPSIYSRRADFPFDLVHTNYEADNSGRCLCVWEENWADLKRGLTAQALVERIRDWFARTARGELHQEGQPLEPLIPSTANTLILPSGAPPATSHVQHFIEEGGRYTIVLGEKQPKGDPYVPFAFFERTVAPQVHGALHARPTTLAALQALLEPMDEDVAAALGDWIVAPAQLASDDKMVVLLITIPKKRDAAGDVEGWERWAFTPHVNLHELGEQLGRTARDPHGTIGLVLGGGNPPDLAAIKLNGWRVVQRLDRRTARRYAGNSAERDSKLVGVGAGAIGSNVMANAARAGIGTWTVIDNDILLPHNLVRQVQTDDMVGWAKATTEQALLDLVLAEGGSSSILANVLHPGEQQESIEQAFAAADLVVDFSASPSALAYLADSQPVKRAASFFFNPDGSDLVILAEDGARTLRLDEIEAQYFLAAGTEPLLGGHLGQARIDLLRYSNACQDLTRPLPPWHVQALSGIAAGRLVSLLADGEEASAQLWRLSPATGCVVPLTIPLANVSRHTFDGFRVSVSHTAVETMRALRRAAVPNETGGVLLGSFDLARSVLHILAALPAPPDSRQSPTYFIRGAKDLKPQVDAINRHSAGMIAYVGEWHSHPKAVDARPSDDDEQVFAHLKTHLTPTGAPYVMTICGDKETWLRVGWHGRNTAEGTIVHEQR